MVTLRRAASALVALAMALTASYLAIGYFDSDGLQWLDLARVRILAQPAPPLAAIEEILEKTQPDLLVIGTSRWPALKRMLDRSVAHQVLSNVRCDILALSASSAQRENEAAAPIAMDGFLGREIATDASTAVLNT